MFGWKIKNPRVNYRTSEMSGASDGGLEIATHGLLAGTRVASAMGWRGVESLAKGDMVLTFDNGLQPITDIRRVTFCLGALEKEKALWPVLVPPNALGNKEKLTLLPDQGVMLECEAAADIHGDPFALVAAHALVGERGISRARPNTQIELIAVSFAEDQVIYAEGGALILCLSYTTSLDRILQGSQSTYEMLGQEEATRLVECFAMELEDRGEPGFPQMQQGL